MTAFFKTLKRVSLISVLMSVAWASVGAVYAAPLHATEEASVAVAPHRATYDLSLLRAKPGSAISDAVGRLGFEWTDTCDGWALNQNLDLTLNEGTDDENVITSVSASWEAKDGLRYLFGGRHTVTGEPPETYRGVAAFDRRGEAGAARYALPEARTEPLAADTLFPAAHTLWVLQQAVAGERLVTRPVFDGEESNGAMLVSAFVGPRLASDRIVADLPVKLRKSPLLEGPTWPVRFAFFDSSSETGEPAYEMELTINTQGIVSALEIDYGDFTVKGALTRLDRLKTPRCAKPS